MNLDLAILVDCGNSRDGKRAAVFDERKYRGRSHGVSENDTEFFGIISSAATAELIYCHERDRRAEITLQLLP